jgi:hypothetical protein
MILPRARQRVPMNTSAAALKIISQLGSVVDSFSANIAAQHDKKNGIKI